MPANAFPLDGGCTCRTVRYRTHAAPIVVHACYCRWCQRESGSAFAINAVIERSAVEILTGMDALEEIVTPSASGKGQRIVRCRSCKIALWSHYPGGGQAIAFVRVGTLDAPDAAPPDIHIFTSTRQAWLELPAGARAFAEFYDPQTEWSEDAQQRYRAAKAVAGEPSGV